MMDGPLLSVVVPVYNIEEYIEKCVRSLLEQTYNNLEIILVDDGSTDSSSALCDKLAEKDERVIVLHKPNGGLSDARNYGMALAHGEYLSFIDGDDYLEQGAYEAVMAEFEGAVDIVAFGIVLCYDDGRKIRKAPAVKQCLGTGQGIVALNTFCGLDVSACNKVYKRSLFDGIEFPVGKHCEDYYIMPQLLDRAAHIVMLPDAFYQYRQRSGSITKGSSFTMDYIYAANSQVEYVSATHPDLVPLAEGAVGFAYLTYLNFCIKHGLANEAVIACRMLRRYRSVVSGERRFPLWKRFQYLLACGPLPVYRLLIGPCLSWGSK